uniref:Uncharacterized protein n=1 Tax=Zooxanthella nutricula TaxID=1333877 RepID=A0A7S2KZI4_9DINO
MGGNCCTPGPEDAAANDGSVTVQPSAQGNTMTKRSAAAPAQAQARAAPAASAGGLSWALALQDLEKAETLAYGSVFNGFGPGGGGVALDHAGLKNFVSENCAIPYSDVDTKLIQIAASKDEMLISLSDFLNIMRDNSMSDDVILQKFMGLSEGEDTMASMDCRSGLAMLQDPDLLGACVNHVGNANWESILDAVMQFAEPTVTTEAWTAYCKRVARTARVAYVARLQMP